MPDRPEAIIRSTHYDAPRNSVGGAGGFGVGSNGGPGGPGLRGGREHHPMPRPPAPSRPVRDEMGIGLMVSAGLHTAAVVALLLGLPDLWKEPPPEEMHFAVKVINAAPESRTTQRNPHPKADAPAVAPPPVPAEKPIQDPLTPPPAPPPEKPAPPAPPPPPPPPAPSPPPPAPAPPPPAPPPLPIPKPDVPPPPPVKPDPPKPEPPKPVPKPDPPKQVAQKPAPPKKDDSNNFDSLLNTLTHAPAPQKSDQPPKQQKAAPQQQASASSLPDAPLGSKLSTSEIDALRAAIHPCWDADAGAKDADSLSADIEIDVSPDGTMHNPRIEKVTGGGNDFVRRTFAERALRTVLNPQCNKIPIPDGKYDQMKTLTITFVPGDIQ
jgi:hypothetical protein